MIRRTLSTAGALARTNSAAMLGANLGVAAFGFVTGIVTARALGPAGRGEYTVITLWPAIIALLVDLSVAEAVTLRVAANRASARSGLAAGAVIAAGGICVGSSAGWFALRYLLRTDQAALLSDARTYLLGFLPASLLSAAVMGGLMGLQRFRAVAAVRIVGASLFLVAVTATALTHSASPRLLAWLTAACTAVPVPLGLWLFGRAANGGRWGTSGLPAQALSGARLQTTRVVGAIAGLEDRAIASWTLGQADIGTYQIPSSLTYVMPVIALSFSQVLFSRLAQVEAVARGAEIVRAFSRSVLTTGLVACLALPLLPFLIPLVYGREFAAAVWPAAVVLVGAVFGAGSQVLQSSARAALQVRVCIEAEALAVLAMAAAAWFLAHRYGLPGLAVSYLVGRATSLAWMIAQSTATLAVPPQALWLWSADCRRAILSDWRAVSRLISGARNSELT